MGHSQPLFHLFSVFSNINTIFYNKQVWKTIHPVCGTGIQTHDLLDMSLLP